MFKRKIEEELKKWKESLEIKKKAFSANRCIQHIGGSTVKPIAPPENKS